MKFFFNTIVFCLILSCNNKKVYTVVRNNNMSNFKISNIDSISFEKFQNDEFNIYKQILFQIRPQMFGWAYDKKDRYTESYLINNRKLKIFQPLKVDTIPITKNIYRKYLYANKEFKTTRVISDSLSFDFDKIVIDYGYNSDNIYDNNGKIILINEPTDWTGTSNQYRFVQVFDFNKLTCYELFVYFDKLKIKKNSP